MPTPPLSREAAEAFYSAIESALLAGHFPPKDPAINGRDRRSALNVAAESIGIKIGSAFTHLESCRRALRRDPDWSLGADQRRLLAQRGYAPDYDLVKELPEGLILKGTSLRYNSAGGVEQYWNKSRLEGRHPDDATKLPDPKTIVKLSTLYDQQGRVTQQWVAEKPQDVAKEKAWRQFAKELAADLPRAKPIKGPKHASKDLMAAYPVGDHHLGALSWDEEAGDNYDLKIGERLLAGAVDYLIDAAPPCEQSLIAVLGDFMHYDSFEAVTPTNRNLLDADSRYPKMVRVAIRCLRYMVEAALKRHKKVHVIVEIGNHDLSSSIFLMECLANIYQKEKRVTVDTSPAHYHYYEFGRNLIGTHHGHGVKMDRLPLIMATDKADAWGKTRFRYWWTGHIHHKKSATVIEQSQDYNGCSVESFRVLCPPDAWAAQKGYRPIRDMKAIILHREFGEVARHTVNPGMFDAKAPR
jgi:hypothetical protein